jgi:nitrous oxide reductase accessory protein NosL
VVCLTSGLTACRQELLCGPPTLHLGRDECAGCGMIINEDRCASALLVEDRGERRYLVFDDIGCMLDFEKEGAADLAIVGTFVRDHASRQWMDGRSATYLFNEKIATPMGSGLVAFSERATAEAKRSDSGGEVLELTAVTARHAAVSAESRR